ncbi:NUDIX hydrolase [Lampropedia aestuarii]|uniref:NUDIX hydrolase n=1 Tax=Lampropedia aestuarii TaxID=2562762 RepID=UPI00246905B8|nr:NUDIX domain-containing protein [Lampropedia aestuarii]MDH5857814.1 NUDIX domain-containing protein [Lampropedia aestuarii]
MKTLNIATACFLNNQQELLVVRKKNTFAWMLPGGKLDCDETASEALVRELAEELQIEVDISALHLLGKFTAVAANEVNTSVNAHVFLGRLANGQTPIHAAEIEAMKWLSIRDPLPEGIAPLLKNSIIPILQSMQ